MGEQLHGEGETVLGQQLIGKLLAGATAAAPAAGPLVVVPLTRKGMANDMLDLRNVASEELHDPSAPTAPVPPAPPVAEMVSNVLVPPADPIAAKVPPAPPDPIVTV